MEIITNTTNFNLDTDAAVAIGKFDGLHIGHRKLIDLILQQKAKGLAACVFTFDPAPAVLFGFSDGKELTTKEEKRRILADLGVDILIEFPMTKETAAISPETFVREILSERMRARYIAAGTDLSFGDKGKGNTELLKSMGVMLGIHTETIEKISIDGVEVSSTFVRERVEEGDMETVTAFLGQPYCVQGEVVHGNHLGSTIGFPTVNQIPPATKLLPPCGVYLSTAIVKGKKYNAISNVGFKPTVSDGNVCGVETYLYDFDQDIYGEDITVFLEKFSRPEQKFDKLESLIAQLQHDIASGKVRN